jgi:hypothetical protein
MKIKVIYRHCEPTPESERAEQIVARGVRRIIFEEIEKIERRERLAAQPKTVVLSNPLRLLLP